MKQWFVRVVALAAAALLVLTMIPAIVRADDLPGSRWTVQVDGQYMNIYKNGALSSSTKIDTIDGTDLSLEYDKADGCLYVGYTAGQLRGSKLIGCTQAVTVAGQVDTLGLRNLGSAVTVNIAGTVGRVRVYTASAIVVQAGGVVQTLQNISSGSSLTLEQGGEVQRYLGLAIARKSAGNASVAVAVNQAANPVYTKGATISGTRVSLFARDSGTSLQKAFSDLKIVVSSAATGKAVSGSWTLSAPSATATGVYTAVFMPASGTLGRGTALTLLYSGAEGEGSQLVLDQDALAYTYPDYGEQMEEFRQHVMNDYGWDYNDAYHYGQIE